MCDNCGQNATRYKAFGATGWRYFCSERCYARFNAMPIQEEGYYGLERLE
jgi:YHS domain-containing protein|tara:strand:+ start:895 stop:1044 length:150 start_codon:yes stop_codon:yes gene_type:complete